MHARAGGCRGRWRRTSPPGARHRPSGPSWATSTSKPSAGQAVGDRRRRAAPRLRPPGRASLQCAGPGATPLHHAQVPLRVRRRASDAGSLILASSTLLPSRVDGTAGPSLVVTRCVAAPRFDPPPPERCAGRRRTSVHDPTKASNFPMTATFAGLGLSRRPRRGPGAPGHHRAVPHPGAHHPRRPRRARRAAARPRPARARPWPSASRCSSASARPSPASPRPGPRARPVSWPPRSRDVLAPARRGARPQGARRLRRRRRWTRRSPRCRRASTSSSARPAGSSTSSSAASCRSPRSRCSSLDEADRMADMGFMPQVQKILYRIDGDAPDDAVLGDARRRGRSAWSTATCTTRSRTRSSRRRADRRRDGPPLPPRAPDGQGEGGRGDRAAASTARSCSCAPSAAPTGSSSSCVREGVQGRRDPRRPAPGRARAGARRLHGRQGAGARRHRRRRPRHPRRRRRRRRPLRPARGRQGLPPPLRSHRPGGGERRGGHADAVEPGERDPRDPASPRPPDPGRRGLLQRPPPRRPRRTWDAVDRGCVAPDARPAETMRDEAGPARRPWAA